MDGEVLKCSKCDQPAVCEYRLFGYINGDYVSVYCHSHVPWLIGGGTLTYFDAADDPLGLAVRPLWRVDQMERKRFPIWCWIGAAGGVLGGMAAFIDSDWIRAFWAFLATGWAILAGFYWRQSRPA